MASIKIQLRKDQPDKEGLCKLIILYRNGNETPLKHSIREKILPNQFDTNKEIVVHHPRAKEINYLIEKHIKIFQDILFDLQRQDTIPSVKRVKGILTQLLQQQKYTSLILPENSDDQGDELINNSIPSPAKAWVQFTGLRRNTVSPATTSIYKTTFDHLQKFCIDHNKKLSWVLFDNDFFYQWNNYFIEECENQFGDTGLSNNTIGKYFKTLKTFLHWAVEKDYHTNLKFVKYKVFRELVDIFPLSETHLAKLVDFCENEENAIEYRRTASLFVFLASTGLRYSDGQTLRWSDIFYSGEGDIDQQVLKVTTKKTSQKLSIPLSIYSIRELIRNANDLTTGAKLFKDMFDPKFTFFKQEDIRKYFRDDVSIQQPLLPKITSSKFNIDIKEVGRLCGFDEPISIIRKIGNKVIRKDYRRWQKLASHDCRRTFITLSLMKGMRPETVMEITGHSSYKTMLRYNKITDKIKINEFHNAWGKSIKLGDDAFEGATFSFGTMLKNSDPKV